MTRKEKINIINIEIQDFEWSPGMSNALLPISDKLNALLELFNVEKSGHSELVRYVKNRPILNVEQSIKDCYNTGGKNDQLVNETLREIKYYTSRAVKNFLIACEDYNVDILDEV